LLKKGVEQMPQNIKMSWILGFFVILAAQTLAQTPPTEARIKKDLMNPGVIEIIIRGKGSFEKFVTNGAVVNEYYRSVTVRRKTDKPGITLDVLGDVVYRLIGGRWVYRTMRLAGNTYGGIKNPTVAELNKLVEKMQLKDIHNLWEYHFIGEIESIKIYSYPKWEWHTPNSVSFNVVMVHSMIYSGGSYNGEPQESASPDVFVDRVERIQRWRIYRDDEKQPWKSATATEFGNISSMMRDENNNSIPRLKLLGRKKMSSKQADNMPRPTKIPFITE
jgi:hypothetical protein